MMGCGAGAQLPWVGEHSAWEKRGRGSLGKDLEGARVQDLPDRLGQPHCSGSTEVPGVAALMGVPQQVLSLPETWQGGLGRRDVSGSWVLVLSSRNKEGVGNSGPLFCKSISCCHPISRVSGKQGLYFGTPGTQCLTSGSLPISISSLHGVSSSRPTLLSLCYHTCHLSSGQWAGEG